MPATRSRWCWTWFRALPPRPRPRGVRGSCRFRPSATSSRRCCPSFPDHGGSNGEKNAAPPHLIDLMDVDREFVLVLFERADQLRAVRKARVAPRPLAGRTAAMVFHKPSLRTRVSFTVGMHELGGDAIDLSAAEVSESGRESLKDVAQVLSGMCWLIVVRTFAHRIVLQLAEHATVPVINALTDFSHPC